MLDDVKQYHRHKLLLGLLNTLVLLGCSAVWARWGGEWPAALSGQRWVSLLLFAGGLALSCGLLSLPLDFYGEFVIEHRYGTSNQSLRRWASQTLKGWLVGGLLGAVVVALLYGLLWYGGDLWWLWVWTAWIGLAVVAATLFPVLLLPVFFPSEPLRDPRIIDTLQRLAQESRLRLTGIYRLVLSEDTRTANAMLTGLGSTRRVYLADNLLDALNPREIAVVFAHELGHHTRSHIWKMLAGSAALNTVRVAVLVYFLDPWKGPDPQSWPAAVAALPLIVVCLTLLGLILRPLRNALSRRFERQCDVDALSRTSDPESYRSAFTTLAEMNLIDPEPHPLVEWYCHDHPAMSKRIALADDVSAHE